jgi:hypothetical protein
MLSSFQISLYNLWKIAIYVELLEKTRRDSKAEGAALSS